MVYLDPYMMSSQESQQQIDQVDGSLRHRFALESTTPRQEEPVTRKLSGLRAF